MLIILIILVSIFICLLPKLLRTCRRTSPNSTPSTTAAGRNPQSPPLERRSTFLIILFYRFAGANAPANAPANTKAPANANVTTAKNDLVIAELKEELRRRNRIPWKTNCFSCLHESQVKDANLREWEMCELSKRSELTKC